MYSACGLCKAHRLDRYYVHMTVTAADTCQRRHCSVPGLGLPREQLQDLHGNSCSEKEK